MRGTALHVGTIGLWMMVGTACSFDPSAAGGAVGGGDDGGGSRADGGSTRPDSGDQSPPDAAPPDAQVPTTGLVTCTRTRVPPALDGAPLGPWQDVEFIRFAASDGELVADVHPTYGFDAAVSLACLHDDENVYFFADVEDSQIVVDSLSLREDDAVVIFLDGSGDRDGSYGEDDHALVLGAGSETWDYGPGDLVPTGEVVSSEAGYRIEVALDKVAIASQLPGQLGFNLAIIDDDGKGNDDRDVFSLRHVPHPPACARCCDGQAEPWCDTSQLGALELVEE